MSESTIRNLSMTIDYTNVVPRVLIDGTNYAANIEQGGLTVQSLTPSSLKSTARVTVTFVVDDLHIVSGNAEATTNHDLTAAAGRAGLRGGAA